MLINSTVQAPGFAAATATEGTNNNTEAESIEANNATSTFMKDYNNNFNNSNKK